LDEKWFRALNKFMSKRRRRKGKDPELPAKKVHSKDHIDQIMFLTVIGVPQDSPDGTVRSDGKIAMIPLAERVPAARTSKYREAGTLEVKPVNVTADYFYDVMTRRGGVLDLVRQKMPWMEEGPTAFHIRREDNDGDDDDDDEGAERRDPAAMPLLPRDGGPLSRTAARRMNRRVDGRVVRSKCTR
jgi:hypothetical protein